jgi:hypothetical protein
MHVSTRSLRWFGFLLVMTVGCAPSGSHDALSPTAPSSLSGGGSASGSSASVSVSSPIATLRPGALYDATDSWHLVIKERSNGAVLVEFDAFLTQDTAGNITFTADIGALYTFTLRGQGTGRMIAYELSVYAPISLPNSPCETRISGPAQLDTMTDTITVRHFSGIEDDCASVSGFATLSRN